MNPEQPEPAGGQYDFIVNPNAAPQKTNPLKSIGQNSFFKILAIVIGGAIVVMVSIAVVVNIFLGDKTNLEDIVGIAESQSEIMRLSDASDPAIEQIVKNAAITTYVTASTQRQDVIAFLQEHNRTMSPAELAIKASKTTDALLKSAQETSTFDATYTKVIRESLTTYGRSLADAHDRATSTTERALLSKHYAQTQLLLKQWPPDANN